MEKYMHVTLPLVEARSRQGFRDWSGGRGTSDEPLTLMEALEDFRSRNAGRHCDKVYALVGLVHNWYDGQPIVLDYTLSAQQVYINTAKHLIQSLDSLVVLTANHGKRQYADLPSWVPDWSFGTPMDLPHNRYVLVQPDDKVQLTGPRFDLRSGESDLNRGLYYLLDHLCGPVGHKRPYRYKALYGMYDADKDIPGYISFPSDRLLSVMGYNFGGLSALFPPKERLSSVLGEASGSAPSGSGHLSLAAHGYLDILNENLGKQPGWAEADIVIALRWRDQFVNFRTQYMHESESSGVKFGIAFARLMLADRIVLQQDSSSLKYRHANEVDLMIFNTWLEELDDVLEGLPGELAEVIEAVKHTLSYAIRNQRPFIAKTGFLALGPENMLPQDEVWVLAKTPTPVILRPSSNGRHTYVGDAFVLNLMDGEAAREGRNLERVFIE